MLTNPRNWTLRSQLLAGVLVLFTVVMLGTGIGTVLATRRYLTNQQISALQGTSDRFNGLPDRNSSATRVPHDDDGGPDGIPGSGGSTLFLRYDAQDQIVLDGAGQVLNHVVADGRNAALSAEQIATLRDARLSGDPKVVDLGERVGSYLVMQTVSRDGDTTIVGLPMAPVNHATDEVLNIIIVGTLVGLVVVVGGGSYLIRRNLRPLGQVAATAQRVSGLKLDTGDVALHTRVAAGYTNPRTEVGQVGLALNSLLDNVEGALQARQESEMRVRQFVADASHELRTPLASIRGYAELSRREQEPVPASVTHALGRVESEALRMSTLVDDLLLLARLDEGRPLAREEVDLTMLAIDAVSDAHAASPDHRWQLDLPDEPVAVTGDSQRLHQVLTNLLANARTHTPEGTTVVTSIREEHFGVRLSVTDNGPGIPESLRANVFERFTRGDEARNRAGGSTGLGLSIVAAVSQAHGGRVSVDSEPGRTTFSVLLPRAA